MDIDSKKSQLVTLGEYEKDGVSLREIIYLFKRNIFLILLITILFTIGGAVYGLRFKKIVYSASATAVVQVDNASITEYNAFVYASYLVNSMKEFITCEAVTKKVAEEYLNDQYEFAVHTNDDETKYVSKDMEIELSLIEYDNLLKSKAAEIKRGTNISTSEENLILTINYSCDDPNEAVTITDLLIKKAKEVALTKKNIIDDYIYPDAILTDVAKTAIIKSRNYELVDDESGNKYYKSSDGNSKLTINDFNLYVERTKKSIQKCLVVYANEENMLVGINYGNYDSDNIDITLITYCVELLAERAKNGELVANDQTEYMYPIFANKLVEMDLPKTATGSRGAGKVIIISFLVGLFLSFGIIFIKYLLDDTFTSKEDIERISGANVLSMINSFDVKEVR